MQPRIQKARSGEQVEHLLDHLDEMFTLHPSPSEMAPLLRVAVVVFVVIIVILFARRLRLPLCPRLALVEGGHRRYRPIRRV